MTEPMSTAQISIDPSTAAGATRAASSMLGAGSQPVETLGGLFATASRDLSTLVRHEVALAKAEVKVDVKNGVKGGAMFGAAAFLGLLAVILLSIALAEGLVRAGVVTWLAFLIVALLYIVLAGVLAFVGKKAVSRVGAPERTIRTTKDTAAFLKSPLSGGDTSGA